MFPGIGDGEVGCEEAKPVSFPESSVIVTQNSLGWPVIHNWGGGKGKMMETNIYPEFSGGETREIGYPEFSPNGGVGRN